MTRSTRTPGLTLALLLASACNSLDGDPPTPATAPVDAGPDPIDGGTGALDAGDGPDGLTVRVEPSFDTTPGTGFTSCEEHLDCVLAGAGCNGCCQQSAVHRSLVSDYEQALADACDAAGPPGAICDCAFGDLVPRCEAGRCVAVERGQLRARRRQLLRRPRCRRVERLGGGPSATLTVVAVRAPAITPRRC